MHYDPVNSREYTVAKRLLACIIVFFPVTVQGCKTVPSPTLLGLEDPMLLSLVARRISTTELIAKAKANQSYRMMLNNIDRCRRQWKWAIACYDVYYQEGPTNAKPDVDVGVLILYENDHNEMGYLTNAALLPAAGSNGPIDEGSAIRQGDIRDVVTSERKLISAPILASSRQLFHRVVEGHLGAYSVETEGGSTGGGDLWYVEVVSPTRRGWVFGVNSVAPADLGELSDLGQMMCDVVRIWRAIALLSDADSDIAHDREPEQGRGEGWRGDE